MRFGYYFTDGRYGNFTQSARSHTNLYHCFTWRQFAATEQERDDSPTWMRQLVRRCLAAKRRGHAIYLALEVFATHRPAGEWKLVLKKLSSAGAWPDFIDLADEPMVTLGEVQGVLGELRDCVRKLGHDAPPVGLTHNVKWLREHPRIVDQLSFAAAEYYANPYDSLVEQAAALDAGLNVLVRSGLLFLVPQAYLRGTWALRPIWDTLRLNRRAVTWALKNHVSTIGVIPFAYGRPTGLADPRMEPVRLYYERIAPYVMKVGD